MDDTYQDYINRVARLTLPATCSMQLQGIQQSPKFADGQATSFPGYSIVTPPGEGDAANSDFYRQLETLQQQLSLQLESDLLIYLPPESFHFTLADLIWDNTYSQVLETNPNFESNLRKRIAEIFQQYQSTIEIIKPIRWQLWGMVVRPRAIMACLIPENQDSYDKIVQLRRFVYQDKGLVDLGIEQQYDFTAHVTLGYFGNIPSNLNRDRLCVTLSQMNDRLIETQLPTFNIERAELRKFDSMINYYRESDWPTISFNI